MKTLSEIINKLHSKGYKTNFGNNEGVIINMETKKRYQPEELEILKVYRFEGDSNPDDSSVLYVMRDKEGNKGSYVDAYGAYAGEDAVNLTKFIRKIPEKIQDNL